MKFFLFTLSVAVVLLLECQGQKFKTWRRCGLCGDDDTDCKTRCKDVPVPAARVRREECRFCTKEKNYVCWVRCLYLLSECPNLCRNSAPNDPTCLVKCKRQYGQWK